MPTDLTNAHSATDFQTIYDAAHIAGESAARAVVPIPMHVVQLKDPFDENSEVVKRYAPVMDGVCGFAWVNIKPGNSAFARWLKANGKANADKYSGGVTVWVRAYDQSMTRKVAYASAFALVLSAHSIRAYAENRMD